MMVLCRWDAGPDLVLFYKYLMVLNGDAEYALHFNETDELSPAQRQFAEDAYGRFRAWYASWNK
jgi:4-hydroxy-tetrahydrodipicolinate synthase